MTARRPTALLAVPLLLLAACSSDGQEGAAAPSTTSAATPDVDYPDEGVDLVGIPELKGVYTRALRTYVDFERGRRLSARDGRVDRMLAFNATGEVVDAYRRALAAYDDRGSYGGDVTIEFVRAEPHGDRLLLDLCVDATALRVPDGAPGILGEPTRAPQQVEVTNFMGPWRVTRADRVDGSC